MRLSPESQTHDDEANELFAASIAPLYVQRALASGYTSRDEIDDTLARETANLELAFSPNPRIDVERVISVLERLLDDDVLREYLHSTAPLDEEISEQFRG